MLQVNSINNENIFPDSFGIYKDYFYNDNEMLTIQGNSLSNKNRFKDAVDKYELAIKLNKNNEVALVN